MSGKFDRRQLPLAALALTLTIGFAASPYQASAQNWPERNVQMIVSYGAGGGTDRQSRVTARYLEKALGVPVAVQNMPGAGSQVATTALMREDPDGYTILATNQPDLSMRVALHNAPFSLDDISILAVDVFDPRLLVVNKDSPFKTFDDFVKEARAKPGTLSFSSTAGNAQDAFTRWLIQVLKLDVKVVGYKSGGEAASALLGGHVTASVGDDFSRLNMREQVRGLLLAANKPSPRWPEAELMTDIMKRYGVEPPSADFLARYHVYAVRADMKKQYPDRYKKLQEAFFAVAKDPEYRALIKEQGYEDLALMKPGEEYEANFAKTLETLKEMRRALK